MTRNTETAILLIAALGFAKRREKYWIKCGDSEWFDCCEHQKHPEYLKKPVLNIPDAILLWNLQAAKSDPGCRCRSLTVSRQVIREATSRGASANYAHWYCSAMSCICLVYIYPGYLAGRWSGKQQVGVQVHSVCYTVISAQLVWHWRLGYRSSECAQWHNK